MTSPRESSRPRQAKATGALRIGRVAGVQVHLDWSLIIIFLLITTSLAVGLLPYWHPDWGPVVTWGTAVAAAVLFLLSVLLHELSHAVVGRHAHRAHHPVRVRRHGPHGGRARHLAHGAEDGYRRPHRQPGAGL